MEEHKGNTSLWRMRDIVSGICEATILLYTGEVIAIDSIGSVIVSHGVVYDRDRGIRHIDIAFDPGSGK
jgi:hypothetical protein